MKKWLSLVLALVMLVGMMPADALAAGTLTITKKIPGTTGIEDEFVVKITETSMPDSLPYTLNGAEKTLTKVGAHYELTLKAGDEAVIDLSKIKASSGSIRVVEEVLPDDSIYQADQNKWSVGMGPSSEDKTIQIINRFKLATAIVGLKDESQKELTYNGGSQEPEVSVKVGGNEIDPDHYDVIWYKEGDPSTPVTPKDVGNYIGVVKAKDGSSCTGTTASQPLNFTIKPAPLDLAGPTIQVVPGASLPSLEEYASQCTVAGLMPGDSIDLQLAYSTGAATSSKGEYPIQIDAPGLSGNYVLRSAAAGKLIVKDPDYQRGVYGDIKSEGELSGKTVGTIKAELNSKLSEKIGLLADETFYYDLKVQYSFDNVNWYDHTSDTFPAGGVELRMAYPQGTSADKYDFYFSHMFAHTVDRLGIKAGDIESGKAEEREDGIYFRVTGMSPLAVGYMSTSTVGGTGPEPEPEPEPEPSTDLPRTGDGTPLWLLGVLCLTSLGLAGIILRRKKRA